MPSVQVFEELRTYVRFDAAAGDALRAFLPKVQPHFERLAREFYERIREHEDAHAVLAGEAQIVRLQGSMVRWLGRIFSGPWDSAYIAQSISIGQVHIRVGVPPRFVCSAMNLLRVGLTRVVESEGANDEKLLAAIHQVLDLELATMIESYCVNFTRRVRSQAEEERAHLAQSLEVTERQYQQAVELAGMIVIGLDTEGRLRLFNPEAERTTAFERDEVEGMSFVEELVEPADRERVADLLRSPASGGEVHRANFAIRVRSQRVRFLAASLSTGLAGELATIIMAQDVTEARQLAEKGARAEKLAAVGTLAAGLAHEIRNPLNGAHLHLAYLRRELTKQHADPELMGAVAVVGDEIQRLSKLVTEFLQFARPRPLERRAVSLGEVVRRVERLLQQPGKSTALYADLPLADVVVEGDADQLEQLLLNLARNAIEALAGRSNGVVTLRLRRSPREALVEVEDNGPGLANPEAPIFDAFFTTKAGGTGLGLSIVHRIAQDHGGTVEVVSEPGRTVFTTRLPLALHAGGQATSNREGSPAS